MQDYLVNITTKINNINYDYPKNVNFFSKTVSFFNPDIKEPMHKFWYFIPLAKLLRVNDKTIQIVLSSQNTDLISSIDELDTKTCEILAEVYSLSIIGNSTINKQKNQQPTMSLHITPDVTCFDSDGKLKNIYDFDLNSKLMLFVEFDCVVLTHQTIFRKWNIIQMKELKNINMSQDWFCPVVQTNDTLFCLPALDPLLLPLPPPLPPLPPPPNFLMPPPPLPPLPPPLNLPLLTHYKPQHQTNKPNKPSTPKQVKYAPTKTELVTMKSMLKKIVDPDTKAEINELLEKSINDYKHFATLLEFDVSVFLSVARQLERMINSC